MLEVCVGSFYLGFFLFMLMKNTLVFYAIKKGEKSYDHILILMIIFDFVILLTLPLFIMMTKGVC